MQLPLIYTNRAYTLVFILIYGVWALSEFWGPVRWGQERKGEKQDRGSLVVGFVSGPLGTVLSLLLPLFLPGAKIPGQPASFFIGVGVVCAGLCLRWFAILTLGKYFTAVIMTQENQPLIQHGPYRLVRHPSYTGVLIIMGGMGIMIGNWFSVLAILLCFGIGLLYRIEKEEQELLRAFGSEYEQYRKHTKCLLPFIF